MYYLKYYHFNMEDETHFSSHMWRTATILGSVALACCSCVQLKLKDPTTKMKGRMDIWGQLVVSVTSVLN